MSAHCCRDKNGAGHARLSRRKVRHLYDIIVGKLVGQQCVGGNLENIVGLHGSYLARGQS